MSKSRKGKDWLIGSNNPHWRGGKRISHGYVQIYKPNHPFSVQGYIPRSRFVMEQIIGRYLKPKERVHHKGIKYPIGSIKNKQNDRPVNLQLFANESKHQKFHWFIQKQNLTALNRR